LWPVTWGSFGQICATIEDKDDDKKSQRNPRLNLTGQGYCGRLDIDDPLRSTSQSGPDGTAGYRREAGRIISEYIEPGPRDAEQTLTRLIAVLDT